MMDRGDREEYGFSLGEVMISLFIISIILLIAMQAMSDSIVKYRVAEVSSDVMRFDQDITYEVNNDLRSNWIKNIMVEENQLVLDVEDGSDIFYENRDGYLYRNDGSVSRRIGEVDVDIWMEDDSGNRVEDVGEAVYIVFDRGSKEINIEIKGEIYNE